MSAIVLGAVVMPLYILQALGETVCDLARLAWTTGRNSHREH